MHIHLDPVGGIAGDMFAAVDYQDPLLARMDYANLEGDAEPCMSCGHQACMGSCPRGIPIAELTFDAANRFA